MILATVIHLSAVAVKVGASFCYHRRKARHSLHLPRTSPRLRRVNKTVFHMKLPFQKACQIVLSDNSLSMKELGH